MQLQCRKKKDVFVVCVSEKGNFKWSFIGAKIIGPNFVTIVVTEKIHTWSSSLLFQTWAVMATKPWKDIPWNPGWLIGNPYISLYNWLGFHPLYTANITRVNWSLLTWVCQLPSPRDVFFTETLAHLEWDRPPPTFFFKEKITKWLENLEVWKTLP